MTGDGAQSGDAVDEDEAHASGRRRTYPRAPGFVLFGGGPQLLTFARLVRDRGLVATVFCAPVHAGAPVDGTPLRDSLSTLGVPVTVCERLDPAEVARHVDDSTIGLSVGALWIFRQDVIELFGGRLLNLHCAALPEQRGGGGFTWQLLSGMTLGGLSLHELTEEVDAGDLVLARRFEYPAACRTAEQMAAHRRPLEEAFLEEFVEGVLSGRAFALESQEPAHATYWPRVSTAVNGWLDWSWTADEIERFVRAFGPPHAGAGTYLGGREVRIRVAEARREGRFHPFQAGLVIRTVPGGADVATREGTLRVIDARDAGGACALARLRPGLRLHTPANVLDRARTARATMGPRGMTVREDGA